MTGWSIDAAGVSAVLTRVQGSAEALGTAMGGVTGAQDQLNAGTGVTAMSAQSQVQCVNDGGMSAFLAPVAGAVVDLLNSQEARITGIATRIQACGLGAAEATTAYENGNLQMAAETQAAATTAAASGDLSFFGVTR
ncbi:MAG: DUF6507 family protein [Naasia sp.]